MTTKTSQMIKISVNGQSRETGAETLAALIAELDFANLRVATAMNGEFVPAGARAATRLSAGDEIEVVSARQGG